MRLRRRGLKAASETSLANLSRVSAPFFGPISHLRKQQCMQRAALHSAIGLSLFLISVAFGTSVAVAQSGSTGGSIGNDEKSLSGSRATQPRAVEREKPARRRKPRAESEDASRRVSRKSGSGSRSGGNFDGAWVARSQGCSGGGTTERFTISSGRISGELSSGSVSPDGSTTSGGSVSGLSWNSSGRFSGSSGSGTFSRSDGCSGTWSASKQ
jgi:hypothetical protein